MESDISVKNLKIGNPKKCLGKHSPPGASEKTLRNECARLLGKLQEGQFVLKSSEQGVEYSPQVKVEREGQLPQGLKSHGKELGFHPKYHENSPRDFKPSQWYTNLCFLKDHTDNVNSALKRDLNYSLQKMWLLSDSWMMLYFSTVQ